MNRVRTLAVAQVVAMLVGYGTHELVSSIPLAVAVAILVVTFLMILLNTVHPPAIGTALLFAIQTYEDNNLLIFALALLLTIALVGLQQTMEWLVHRHTSPKTREE